MPVGALRILFIINPISGGEAKSGLEQTIRDYFSTRSHQIEFYQLSGENDVSSVKYWVERWQPDRVVAAGGDGTLRMVAQVMSGTEIPVGLLPAGSANGMARELNIPENFTTCLDIITGDHMAPVDIIRLNEREICLHLSDFGLNAHLVKNFEQNERRGMWGYAKEIVKVMSHRKQFRVEIRTPGKTVFRYAWMVVIANARMYGTGAMINPGGNPGDGLLEIIVMRKISIWEILKMMLRHRPFNPDKTEVIQAREVAISMKRSVHFQVDGEYLGLLRKIKAKVQPGAIRMLLPQPDLQPGK